MSGQAQQARIGGRAASGAPTSQARASGRRSPLLARAGRSPAARRLAAPLALAALALLVLAPLALARRFPASYDTDAFYAPLASFLHHELAAGRWPAWNPYAFAGMPFAADPQSGAFYPPALLSYGLLSPANGLVALTLFHYGLAIAATYALCRRRGLSQPAAAYAALGYGTSALLLARAQALTLLAGAAWLPVCLWAAQRAGRRRDAAAGILLGGCLVLQLTAGAQQLALVTMLACAALVAFEARRDAWRPLLVAGATLLALASPFLLAVLQLSGRSAAAHGVDPSGFGELGLDNLRALYGSAGPAANEGGPLYAGILTPVLALAALAVVWRRVRDLAVLGGGALAWAAGAAGVVVASAVPSLASITAHQPVRALPLLVLTLAIGAATWLGGDRVPRRAEVAAVLVLTAALALALDPGRVASPRAVLAFGASAACLSAVAARPRWRNAAVWGLVIVLAADLASVDYRLDNPHQPRASWKPVAQTFPSTPPTARYLQAAIGRDGPARFASLPPAQLLAHQLRYGRDPLARELLMNMAGTRYGLEDVAGYDPLPLAAYRRFMADSNGRFEDRHFVNALRPATSALRALGVRYYLVPNGSATPPGMRRVFRDDLVSIYRDPQAQPLARFADADGRADLVERTPDRTVVRTARARAGTLVVADRAYPGWTAKVDGRRVRQSVTGGVFRSIEVPAGQHEVVFAFHPTWERPAGAAWLLWLLVVLSAGLWRWRARQPSAAAPPPVTA